MEPENQVPAQTREIYSRIRALPGKLKEKLIDFVQNVKKLGQDDRRRITHSAKVGTALTLVSLLYYLRPLYKGFGESGMWAILTVVVIFEFTVGGTVYKCFNRGSATLVAGALGIGAGHLARLCGEKGDPVVLAVLVFLLAAAATFARFFPVVKRRYDYGVTIFILTFSLVTVSDYRVTEIFKLAKQRLITILIGVGTCLVISVIYKPVWAGEDLHELIIKNIKKLANTLEGFGGENGPLVIFSQTYDVRPNLLDYRTVLTSKAEEESLANFAHWEPGHGSFRHNRKKYLKIGGISRECAYQIEALINARKYSHLKKQTELSRVITKASIRMSLEAGNALRLIASSIEEATHPSPAGSTVGKHLEYSKSAMDELTRELHVYPLNQLGGRDATVGETVQALAAVAVLVEIIKCVERLSESVDDLVEQAQFKARAKKSHFLHRGLVKPVEECGGGGGDHIIVIPSCDIGSPPSPNKPILSN